MKKFIILLLFSNILTSAEAIKSDEFKDLIKFCEYMGNVKITDPVLVSLPPLENLIGKWRIESREKVEIIVDAIACKFNGENLTYKKSGDAVIFSRENDQPVFMVVFSPDGYRAFSGDFMEWPLMSKINKLP